MGTLARGWGARTPRGGLWGRRHAERLGDDGAYRRDHDIRGVHVEYRRCRKWIGIGWRWGHCDQLGHLHRHDHGADRRDQRRRPWFDAGRQSDLHPGRTQLCPLAPPAGNQGYDYRTNLYLYDRTRNWAGGRYRPELSELDCVGLLVSKFSANQVVIQFGAAYAQYGQQHKLPSR